MLSQITATDLYEILPFLLCGVVGSSLCSEVAKVNESRGFTMLIFSLILQGLAFWVSILVRYSSAFRLAPPASALVHIRTALGLHLPYTSPALHLLYTSPISTLHFL